MSRAWLATHSAWMVFFSGNPPTTIYASPMVSTWRGEGGEGREEEAGRGGTGVEENNETGALLTSQPAMHYSDGRTA